MEFESKEKLCKDLNSVISERTDVMNNSIPVNKNAKPERKNTIIRQAKYLEYPEQFKPKKFCHKPKQKSLYHRSKYSGENIALSRLERKKTALT